MNRLFNSLRERIEDLERGLSKLSRECKLLSERWMLSWINTNLKRQ